MTKSALPNLASGLNALQANLFTLCEEFSKSMKDSRTPFMSFSLIGQSFRLSFFLRYRVLPPFFWCSSFIRGRSPFPLPLPQNFVYSQTRGLRQGCPPSPYLFNFVLSHLFYDVETSYTSQFGLLSGVINTPSPLWDLEYADDTALMSNSAEQITRLLHILQSEAHTRGLILNFDKCAHLRLHSDERVFFSPSLSSVFGCFS